MLTRFLGKKSWCEKLKGVEVLSGHQGSIRSCDISNDCNHGATCSGDNSVILWDLAQKRVKFHLGSRSKKEKHTHIVTAVTFSPCGTFLASASWDRTIRVWDVSDGSLLATILAHEKVMTCCSWLPSGRGIVSGSSDGTIRLWRLYENNDDDFSQFSWGGGEPVEYALKFSGIGFHEDVHTLHAARFFEITGHRRKQLDHAKCSVASLSPFEDCCGGGSVAAMAISTCSKKVAAVSPGGALVLMDTELMTEQSYGQASLLCISAACVGACSVSWTECGELLALGSRECNVQIRSACSGDLLVELDARGACVAFMRGSSFMDCLLISGSLCSKAMHVWKIGAPATMQLQVSSKATTAVCIKASGQLIAGRNDSSIVYLKDVFPIVSKTIHTKKALKRTRSNGCTESVDSASDTLASETATIDSAGEVEKLQSVLAEQQAINVQLQQAISKLSERMVKYETSANSGSVGSGSGSSEGMGVGTLEARKATSAPCSPFPSSSPTDRLQHTVCSAGSMNPLARQNSSGSGYSLGSQMPLLRHSSSRSDDSFAQPRFLEPESSLAPDLCTCACASPSGSSLALAASASLAPHLGAAAADPAQVEIGVGAREPTEGGERGERLALGGEKPLAEDKDGVGASRGVEGGGAAPDVEGLRGGLVVTRGQHTVALSGGRVVVHGPSTRSQSDIHDDPRDQARCLSLHPDGDVVAAGGERCIRIWNSVEGKVAKTLGHGLLGRGAEAVDFSPSGRWLACVAEKECPKVLLWDWAQGGLLCMKMAHKHSGAVRCLKFSPEEETRFVTAGQKHFKVWSVEHDPRPVEGAGGEGRADEQLMLRYRWGTFCCGAPPDMVTCVSFGRGGTLYLGTRCGGLVVCSERFALRRVEAHKGAVLALLGSGRRLLSGGSDRRVRDWSEFEDPAEAAEAEVAEAPLALATAADGRVVMLGARTGSVGAVPLQPRVVAVAVCQAQTCTPGLC